MTTSFTPGNNLQGINQNPEPTVLNFYQENIPRGRPLSSQAYWRALKPSQPAKLLVPNVAPFTFTASINDSVSFQINGSAVRVIEFDARTYTSSEIIALFNLNLTNTVSELDSEGRIIMSTIASGDNAIIRVVTGNTVLGLVAETISLGSEATAGASPALTVAPTTSGQVELHYWKGFNFVISSDLLLGNVAILIRSRHYQQYIRSNFQMNPIIAVSSFSKAVIGIQNINSKNWIHCQMDLKTPLKVDGTEDDRLEIALVDANSNIVTDAVQRGEVYVTCEGWSIERARF